MDPNRFKTITRKYRGLGIAVVGDFCLDRYLEIDPSKREGSIETGLPVHNVVNVRAQPGGAGTIVNNLAALGIGRIYPIGFSGDTYATWESLRFLPYFTATAANVCYGWWSHDIGGHFGATDPELYARWVQFGAVSPCLRLHATKDPLAERRPWAFSDEVFQAAKAAISTMANFFG